MATDTRTALLDCAERAVRSNGFDGFSYADLATAVGIRKASIHYHFPTKADLSRALIERYHDTFARLCADLDARHPRAGDRLMALIAVYEAALSKGKTMCLCVSLTSSRESLSPEVIAKVREFRTMMAGWIATVFEQGRADGSIAQVGDAQDEARAALAVLEGAHVMARAEEDVTLFQQATRLLSGRCAG